MGGLTWEKRDDGIKAGWGKLFQFGLTILLCQALGFRQNPMLSLLGWRNGTSSFHLKETAILDHLKIQKNKLCHICVYIDVLSNMQFFKFTHCQVNTSSHLYFETIKTPFFPSRLCRNNFRSHPSQHLHPTFRKNSYPAAKNNRVPPAGQTLIQSYCVKLMAEIPPDLQIMYHITCKLKSKTWRACTQTHTRTHTHIPFSSCVPPSPDCFEIAMPMSLQLFPDVWSVG